jgi:hypothetical protein
MSHALTYLGGRERIREPCQWTSSFDAYFALAVWPWSCVSNIAVRKMLNTLVVRDAGQRVVTCLAEVCGEDVGDETRDGGD